ncbi:MAG TPA: hypothetical protein VF412_07415 [Bdellovibrio sp.]|uniref:hypothetical protein n=1 Tax=Bdellovibrio sp. TaxID=28201 RepID=UPI002EDE7118
MKSTFAVLLLLVAQGAYAQESMSSAYSFGGACASQGVWTQAALSATQNLRKVTLQLKDDPNCKALGASVQSSINNLESSLKSASDTPARVSRLAQLPQEITALRGFITSAPDMKQQVLKAMMDRSIESATLSAQVGDSANFMGSGILDFGSRLQATTQTGLSMLNQVVDSIPQLNQCLTGDGQAALGAYISTAVQVASSFASSGQDMTGSQLATTISKLSSLVREKKYAKVLRKLNQQEFMASMSCLMEVTSESYCQARDGMRLFQKGMEDLKFRQDKQNQMTSNNPFVGYYILNTHVPNITKWLQKIQIGVDPKLPTDATFQNKIQQEVVDFYKGVKTLLGDYNSALATIKTLPNTQAKQNAVLKLLFKMTDSMASGGGTGYGGDSDKTNFFTMSINSLRIPFDLVGIPVPDQVSGKVMPKLSYDEWFQANMADLPQFKDPVALAETIGRNMQDVIHGANVSAIEYFNKWYIVDKAALVNESTIDINYTVEDSLQAIDQYLESEKGRIAKYNGNSTIVPTIVDTQIRIRTILAAYKTLHNLGQSTLANKANLEETAEQVQKTADTYEKLITTVYEQFNVMQSRSGFLANRMVNFVYDDYVLMIKNKVDFTPYQQDLYTSTGMAAMDKMLQMYNGNPANVQTDLNMALRINKGNIEALEELLKDNVIHSIAELDQVKRGGQGSLAWSSLKRLMHDQTEEESKGNPAVKALIQADYLTNPFVFYPKAAWYWFKHSDRYPLTSKDSSTSPQSEFDDASAVEAQLCIQALAFNNQGPIQSLCKGVILKSPLGDNKLMNVSYDERLVSHLNDKGISAQMKQSLNHSDRICAFRDYNIRNMAKFMSVNRGQ